MYLSKKLPLNGVQAIIIVPQKTKQRLRHTCFRGTEVSLAGNFYFWESAEALLENRHVMAALLRKLDVLYLQASAGTHSQSISVDDVLYVGWESTDEVQKYPKAVLEEFHPNRRSTALRVKSDCWRFTSPKTNLVTLVYEVRYEERGIVAIMHSIYPGVDIGKLKGDVTAREGRIFFDWNHPGEE